VHRSLLRSVQGYIFIASPKRNSSLHFFCHEHSGTILFQVDQTTLMQPVKQCIDECTRCMIVCQETAIHCLEEGLTDCAKMLLNCAEICDMCATFCSRNSYLTEEMMELCRQFCDASIEACHKYEQQNEACKICAIVCQSCANACEDAVAIAA
jgi:hypothetical protein